MSRNAQLAATVERALTVLHELQEQLVLVQSSIGAEGDCEVISILSGETSEPAPASSPAGTEPILRPGSPAWVRALQSATTPGQFLALDLSPVSPLLAGQRLTEISGWNAQARLGAALRSGCIARDKLAGASPFCETPIHLPWSVKLFIVLRGRDHPEGFWTTNSDTYFKEVGDLTRRGNLPPGTIQYACASRVEAVAYLLGAGSRWPVQLP